MTSEDVRPVVRRKSTTTATPETRWFSQGCIRLGIQQAGCGLHARDMLKRLLLDGPLKERDRDLGMLIARGLAKYVPDVGYEITVPGVTWLRVLKKHKLLGTLPKGVKL